MLRAVIGLKLEVGVFRSYDTAAWYAAQVSIWLQATVIGRAEPALTGVRDGAVPVAGIWSQIPAGEDARQS